MRAVGATQGRSGGSPRSFVRGVRGWAISLPESPDLCAGGWVRCLVSWARGLRAWAPVTNLTAHALATWLYALSGLHNGAQWGVPRASVKGIRGRALRVPRLPLFGACGWGQLPTGRGCGVRAGEPALPTGRVSLRPLSSLKGSACLGTFSRNVAWCLLCALSWSAAPRGRCCLAAFHVPCLWSAACLSGVPLGPVSVL